MNKALKILKDIRADDCFDKYMNMTDEEIDLLLDEAIAEIKEAIKPKTCDGCKHRSHLDESLTNKTTNGFCVENGFFTRHGFCCNKHEPKDNA